MNDTFLPIDYDKTYAILTPNGMESCDYWFICENGLYHAYYLEAEKFPAKQRIAHAISKDLQKWKYCGTVLSAFDDGRWPNEHLATGSVVKANEQFYMLFTGHDTKNPGLGLAVSKDLYQWKIIGNAPVIPENVPYFSEYLGQKHECHIMADPYIYPQSIDGWFYAYVNSWAIDCPYNSRGCQLMFRTKDFVHWEPYQIAILTDNLDRLETCQVWEHKGIWYMYFGGRRINPEKGNFADIESNNYIYQSKHFDGPYLRQEWSLITYDGPSNCYIQKVISNGLEDIVMIMTPYHGVLQPQRVKYDCNGRITYQKL